MSNRTTVKSSVITKNVPTVTNAILTDILNTEINDNVVFREDVAAVQASGTTNITVNFTGKDRIDLTRTGGALNITVSGMDDGETKYLLITKTAGQAISFVSITDITPIKANVTALSTVLYEIVRKGSNYFARAWVESVKTATETIEGVLEIATTAEANALSVDNKVITPAKIPLSTTAQKGIVELATQTESNALTDVARPVTPGTQPLATVTQKGLIEVATAAENDAGTPGSLAVIASELKRKYDELAAIIAGNIIFSEVYLGEFDSAGTTVTKLKGSLTVTISRVGVGRYVLTHSIGHTNYLVLGVSNDFAVSTSSIQSNTSIGTTTVQLVTADDGTANDTPIRFVILVFA